MSKLLILEMIRIRAGNGRYKVLEMDYAQNGQCQR